MNPEDSIVVGRIGGRNAVLDRHRQDEAVVVIGVLPDQVDPAGGNATPVGGVPNWRRNSARAAAGASVGLGGITGLVMVVHGGFLSGLGARGWGLGEPGTRGNQPLGFAAGCL